MRALITGASGFAGSHLIEHLCRQNDQVIATDCLSMGHHGEGPVRWVPLDVTSYDQCLQLVTQETPDVIYHLAGLAFAPESERNFERALSINVGGAYNILRAAAEHKMVRKVMIVSSSEIYGKIRATDLPVTEDTPIRPPHNYGLSKAMAELVALRFSEGPPLAPCVVVRAFNHIGPRQRPDFVVSSFARQLAQIALKKRPPSIAVGNLDAERDFSDVRDIVRGYRLAVERGFGIVNLCSGRPVSIRFVLETLIAISGLQVDVVQDPARMRPSEVPLLYGSYARATETLGWKPEVPLEQSLRDTYEYWLETERQGGEV